MSEAEILAILKEETGEEWTARPDDGDYVPASHGNAWCRSGVWRVYIKGSTVQAGSDLRTVVQAAVAERAARRAARPNLREVQCCATCVFYLGANCHHMGVAVTVDARGEVCDAWTARGEG